MLPAKKQMQMEDSAEGQLIAALQQRLHTKGPKPKLEMVVAAVAMARDESLDIAAACDSAGVPRGSRARAGQFAERIRSEGLLVACAPSPPPPPPPQPEYGPRRPAWREHHPHVEPPCCPECGTMCELVRLYQDRMCNVCLAAGCETDLETFVVDFKPTCSSNVYWMAECPNDCSSGGYDLCHACTPAAAQVDWATVPINSYRGVPWRGRQRPDSYYEGLDVEEHEALDVAGVDTAAALGLPRPPGLLVSNKWIASNAQNIWWLLVGKFVVSDDGKSATRELTARMRLWSDDLRRKDENGCRV